MRLEILLFLAICFTIGWWAHQAGKREGSRKGYAVGRTKGRRRRPR
jgi:hypothetical protein